MRAFTCPRCGQSLFFENSVCLRCGSAVGYDRSVRDLVLLEDLCELMTDGSLCALGGLTPMPARSAVRHFPGDFGLEVTA